MWECVFLSVCVSCAVSLSLFFFSGCFALLRFVCILAIISLLLLLLLLVPGEREREKLKKGNHNKNILYEKNKFYIKNQFARGTKSLCT